MSWTHSLLFGNWRNKLVALFFSVSIWYVAYQSETESTKVDLEVRLVPEDPAATAIVGTEADNPVTGKGSFGNKVEVTLTGPRKEIVELQEDGEFLAQVHSVSVSSEANVVELRPEMFGSLPRGVSITAMLPDRIEVQLEPVKEIEIGNLAQFVEIPFEQGGDVEREILDPESGAIRLRIPVSLEGAFRPTIRISRPRRGQVVEGRHALSFESKEKSLVEQTVGVWDWKQQRWVSTSAAPTVQLRAWLEEQEVTFDNPAVRVTFRVPLVDRPFQIELHDVEGDTIPLRFIGPSSEIQQLKNRFRDEPTFSLSVLVPNFDPQKGGTFTFSESDLELSGFPGVRLDQHEDRRRELKTAWSYEIKVQVVSTNDE